MNNRNVGRFVLAVGVVALLISAFVYLFGSGSPSPTLLPTGILLIFSGASLIKKARPSQ
ncbi:MAG: hypothetical protein U0175_18780 [Caldilineaceae bacterium]